MAGAPAATGEDFPTDGGFAGPASDGRAATPGIVSRPLQFGQAPRRPARESLTRNKFWQVVQVTRMLIAHHRAANQLPTQREFIAPSLTTRK